MHKLTKLAQDELNYMLSRPRAAGFLTSETPVGRGGSQELMDAGIIGLIHDDGLVAYYKLLVPAASALH